MVPKNVLQEIPLGAELNLLEKKITINKEKIKNDEKIPGDKRTFELLKDIANSIDKDLQVTIEVPSDHPQLGNRLPFLDTMIWFEYGDKNCPQGKIMHKHYSKPMSSKLCVQVESAISDRDIRTINTQELIRCLRNCHEDLPKEEVDQIKSEFMKKLQNSGYDSKYRLEVLKSAEKGLQKQKEAELKGETPMYRPREELKARWDRLGGRPDAAD